MRPKRLDWWLWLASAVLCTLGLFVDPWVFQMLVLYGALYSLHVANRRGVTSFPAQVRIAACAYFIVALIPGLQVLYWVPFFGLWANVLVGYCLMARLLSLAPWNREGPLTLALVRHTLFTPPTEGSILRTRNGRELATP